MSVAPPGPGLGSNFNYFLTDGGNPITGVNVEITFAEPLISTSNGFGFQLNTYAQELPNAPSTTPNWQQYVVFMQPGDTTLYGIIDNWSGTLPSGVYAQVINDESRIASLPTAVEIPAGATINIIPTFDSNNVITGITYVYTPPCGQAVSSSVTLTDLNVFGTSNKITSAYESPIVALTLNIVGDYNGNRGTFSSGSGTIVYSAVQPLTVVTNEPSYTSFGGITGETANTVYGQLPVSNSNSITQSWSIGQSGSPLVEPAVATLNLPTPPSAKKIQHIIQ